jgi:hypothetical protein
VFDCLRNLKFVPKSAGPVLPCVLSAHETEATTRGSFRGPKCSCRHGTRESRPKAVGDAGSKPRGGAARWQDYRPPSDMLRYMFVYADGSSSEISVGSTKTNDKRPTIGAELAHRGVQGLLRLVPDVDQTHVIAGRCSNGFPGPSPEIGRQKDYGSVLTLQLVRHRSDGASVFV